MKDGTTWVSDAARSLRTGQASPIRNKRVHLVERDPGSLPNRLPFVAAPKRFSTKEVVIVVPGQITQGSVYGSNRDRLPRGQVLFDDEGWNEPGDSIEQAR
jgi:hypothetical protein